MERFKFKIPCSEDMNYYYSSEKELSEDELKKKSDIENQLCKYIDVKEVGIHNAFTSVSLEKKDDYIVVSIIADRIEKIDNE